MKAPIIQRNNLHSFCRTCLQEIVKLSSLNGQKFNIYHTPDVLKWLNDCTPLDNYKKDEYPKFICEQCYWKLQSVNEFREMSIKSKQTLDSIFNEVSSEPEIKIEIEITTKKQLLANEAEAQEQDLNISKQNEVNWLDFEAGDKSLITPTFLNNPENIEEEIVSNATETSLESLENRKVFEYKDCSENSFERSIENLQNVRDFLEVDTHANTGDGTDGTSDHKIIKAENSSNEMGKTNKAVKRTLKCSLCPRFFFKQELFDTHLRIHQGLKAYQCNQCDRGYSKKYRLETHISRDHDKIFNDEIICSIDGCGVKCRDNESYRSHCRRKHRNPSMLKMAICEDCGLSFKSNYSLKKHRFKHGPPEAYPFNCEQCGKYFPVKYKYKQHMDWHEGIKHFECEICGSKMTTNSELRIHMNVHLKTKQWPCSHCSNVFNSSRNLGRHVRAVHKGTRQFVCKYCDDSFAKAESLKYHEMRHTGEKPHQCQTCGRRFIQKTALHTHLKLHGIFAQI